MSHFRFTFVSPSYFHTAWHIEAFDVHWCLFCFGDETQVWLGDLRVVLVCVFAVLCDDLPFYRYWPIELCTPFFTAYVVIRTVPQSIYGQTRGKKKCRHGFVMRAPGSWLGGSRVSALRLFCLAPLGHLVNVRLLSCLVITSQRCICIFHSTS